MKTLIKIIKYCNFKYLINIIKQGYLFNRRKKGKHCTLLHYAVSDDDIELVKILLQDKYVDVNAEDWSGETPICRAIRHRNFDIVKLLVENGADVNIVSDKLTSPLYYAVIFEDVNIVKYLIDNGAEVNNRGFYLDRTALHQACNLDRKDIVKLLLEHNINVNIRDDKGETALHYAVINNNTDIIKLLIDNGTEINARNYEGQTALHIAVIYKNIEAIKTLLDSGINKNIKDNEGKTAIDYLKKAEIIIKLLK